MAVISALVAMVVVPSTMALDSSDSTDVSTSILSGEFSLTAHGAYASAIELDEGDNFQVSSSDENVRRTLGIEFTSSNHFELIDYSANDVVDEGATVEVYLDSDFEYDGPTASQGAIPASNLTYAMNVKEGLPFSAGCNLEDGLVDYESGCMVMEAGTALGAFVANLYDVSPDFESSPYTQSGALVASKKLVLESNTDAPYVVRFGLPYFNLLIPANSAAGTYSSTLFVIATDKV